MKTVITLLAVGLLITCGACNRKASAQKDDRSEIMIRHLLRRNSDLIEEASKRENEILEHDNECLKEQIAILGGRPIRHAKSDPLALNRSFREGLHAGLDRLIQHNLDAEDMVENHNRTHPESPQASITGLLRDLCGDCKREREIRDSQLKEEAQQRGTTHVGK